MKNLILIYAIFLSAAFAKAAGTCKIEATGKGIAISLDGHHYDEAYLDMRKEDLESFVAAFEQAPHGLGCTKQQSVCDITPGKTDKGEDGGTLTLDGVATSEKPLPVEQVKDAYKLLFTNSECVFEVSDK